MGCESPVLQLLLLAMFSLMSTHIGRGGWRAVLLLAYLAGISRYTEERLGKL